MDIENKTVVDYRLFTTLITNKTGVYQTTLAENVKEFIDDGWTPLGAPFLLDGGYICQALVKLK